MFGVWTTRGAFIALQLAEQVLAQGSAAYAIVLCVDSYLEAGTPASYQERRRLLTASNTDGFIPGEAAAAVLLSRRRTALRALAASRAGCAPPAGCAGRALSSSSSDHRCPSARRTQAGRAAFDTGHFCGVLLTSLHSTSMGASVPLVPNDFLLAVHRALLLACGVEKTREFWLKHPLEVQGHMLHPGAIARHLTDKAARTPLSSALHVMEALEPFLLPLDIPIERFADSLLAWANRGSFVGSRAILTAFGSLFSLLFRYSDPHRLFLRMLHFGGDRFFPDLLARELGPCDTFGRDREAVLLLGFPQIWRGEMGGWDGHVFSARLLQRMPASLGLSPFRDVHTLADCRTLVTVLGEYGDRSDPRPDPAALGAMQSFDDFCASRGFHIPNLGYPEHVPVFVAGKSYVCPHRQREVLRAGCAYGAPVYLFRFSWTHEPERIHSVFRLFIEEALDEAIERDHELARSLLREFESRTVEAIRLTYDPHDQTLWYQEQLVCRGVPALILRKCLQIQTMTGRSEFGFREFKQDRAIAPQPKNTGFEVRLKRLRSALDEAACGVWIEPTERGRFRMATLGPVSLHEVPPR